MAVVKKPTSAKAVQVQKREAFYQFKKETTGAYQYEETKADGSKITDAEGAVSGGIYLRKTTAKGPAPQRIKVTVEW